MQGWIKLHRKIKDKGWYQKSDYVHLWIHLLLEANHKGKEFMWNGEIKALKAGQFITGRKSISKETNISESKIQRVLKCFENEQQIEQQTTNKFRLITIKNWHEYQNNEQPFEQQVNNKRTTSEQQVNTNKNEKNDKNEKNILAASNAAEINKIFEKFQTTEINPTISYGNKTQRKATEYLLKKFGLKRILSTVDFLLEIRGDPFAPVVTTPHQLKEKMGALLAYNEKRNSSNRGKTIGESTV